MAPKNAPHSPASFTPGLDAGGDDLLLMRLEREQKGKRRRLVAATVAFFFLGQAMITALAIGVRWAKNPAPLKKIPAQCPAPAR